jgi:hypothetical protein
MYVSKSIKNTILFFDDQRLNLFYNMTRKVGKPKMESVFKEEKINLMWAYPGVFKDVQSRMWKLLYQGKNTKGKRTALLAESINGIDWTTVDTTKILNISDRVMPNQILPQNNLYKEWSGHFIDPFAPSTERFKSFVVSDILRIFVSSDGVHWKVKEGCTVLNHPPDPYTGCFWNEVRKSYVIACRPKNGDRRIAFHETKDWIHFTEQELVLQSDGLDSPLTEIYGMPVLFYEGYYIGYLWLYHTSPELGESKRKYLNGHVDCQLTYSINGWHFQRGLREPFIGNGAPDEPTYGCVYPADTIILDDGSILIYASASTREHGYNQQGIGSVVTYSLRRDGFMYLESNAEIGKIGTRPILWVKGPLELNVQSQNGEARVRITTDAGDEIEGYSFEDSIPFSGDDTAWKPIWRSCKTMDELSNKMIRIEIALKCGRIYAIRGDFIPAIAIAPKDYTSNNESRTQVRRPGF